MAPLCFSTAKGAAGPHPTSAGTSFLGTDLTCGLLLPASHSCLLSCCWERAQPPSLAWHSPSLVWGSCQGIAAAQLGVQSPSVLSPCRWNPHGGAPPPWAPLQWGTALCPQPCAVFQPLGGTWNPAAPSPSDWCLMLWGPVLLLEDPTGLGGVGQSCSMGLSSRVRRGRIPDLGITHCCCPRHRAELWV